MFQPSDSRLSTTHTARAQWLALLSRAPLTLLEDVLGRAKTCEKCDEHVQLNTVSLNSGISTPKLLVMEKALNSAPREIKVRDCL